MASPAVVAVVVVAPVAAARPAVAALALAEALSALVAVLPEGSPSAALHLGRLLALAQFRRHPTTCAHHPVRLFPRKTIATRAPEFAPALG